MPTPHHLTDDSGVGVGLITVHLSPCLGFAPICTLAPLAYSASLKGLGGIAP
ncbi:MAG: hypothetical protein HDS52_07330 [Barnesiella sp.]|nr:hypothetical protein [Barnesiella sp.]